MWKMQTRKMAFSVPRKNYISWLTVEVIHNRRSKNEGKLFFIFNALVNTLCYSTSDYCYFSIFYGQLSKSLLLGATCCSLKTFKVIAPLEDMLSVVSNIYFSAFDIYSVLRETPVPFVDKLMKRKRGKCGDIFFKLHLHTSRGWWQSSGAFLF